MSSRLNSIVFRILQSAVDRKTYLIKGFYHAVQCNGSKKIYGSDSILKREIMSRDNFQDYPLSEELLRAISLLGYDAADGSPEPCDSGHFGG